MLGLSRKDRVRNEEIRKRLGTTEMGKWCRQERLRWYGHVKRREDDYVGRRAMEMRMPGQRKRGRPKRRWLDCIKEDMRSSWCEPRRYTRQEEVKEVGPHGSNATAISGTSWKKKQKKFNILI